MRPSGYRTRPDYRVDIHPQRHRLRATRGTHILADSQATLIVDEQDHALVTYFPRAEVALDRLVPMPGRTTHCPYKGDARYWASPDAPETAIAWSYETPYPEVATIAGYIAFYAEAVTIAPVSAPTAATPSPGEIA